MILFAEKRREVEITETQIRMEHGIPFEQIRLEKVIYLIFYKPENERYIVFLLDNTTIVPVLIKKTVVNIRNICKVVSSVKQSGLKYFFSQIEKS